MAGYPRIIVALPIQLFNLRKNAKGFGDYADGIYTRRF